MMIFDFYSEITGAKDPDNSKEAKKFYKEFFSWSDGEGMRGDVICSFSSTFGKCNKYTDVELTPLQNGLQYKRSYTKDVFDSPEKDKVLEFRKKYHSLANFWVIPDHLNSWRGMKDKKTDTIIPAQGDYIDIFLDLIRNYYLGITNPNNVLEKFNEKDVKKWLDFFGENEEGWRNFVDKNYMSVFVRDDTYEVKDIFSPNFQNENAEKVGTYHKYQKAMPWEMRKQKAVNNAVCFVTNSLWAIEKRAEQLCNANL